MLNSAKNKRTGLGAIAKLPLIWSYYYYCEFEDGHLIIMSKLGDGYIVDRDDELSCTRKIIILLIWGIKLSDHDLRSVFGLT